MSSKHIGVCAANAAAEIRATNIATQLQLPYVEDPRTCTFALIVSESSLSLRRTESPVIEWAIDFLSPAYRHKRAQRTRKNDMLTRALGLHKTPHLRVLDMSAGLGKDGYWIAFCGAHVTLLERNPVLALLLQEAIQALRHDPTESDVGARMQCMHTDARSFLTHVQPGQFDVAYYDPMFLPRRKSALVKKDMQIMHDLLGDDPIDAFWPLIQDKIPRLVVKRAKSDPPYDESMHWVSETSTTRYEVYQKNK